MTFLPIVERELRVAARQPSTSLLRFLVALVGVILWLGQFAQVELRRHFRAIARSDYTPRFRGPSEERSRITLPAISDATLRRDTA